MHPLLQVTHSLVPLGEHIRHLRLCRGWSQATLGRRAGVRQATISALEMGRPARASTLATVAKALGTDIPSIAAKSETPFPSNASVRFSATA